MTVADQLLKAYDQQLRTDAETPSAVSVARLRSLRLVTFPGGRGFVTYPHPEGVEADGMAQLVEPALDHYRSDAEIVRVEWKSRGHDRTPGLHEALLAQGFTPDESESIMIGQASYLDVDIPLPPGVTLRQVTEEADVRAMAEMQDAAFGSTMAEDVTGALMRRISLEAARGHDLMQLWVAESNGQVISAGRLEPVAGTEFAGIWGGATLEAWRGQGIYRALTAARARSALALGKVYIHSDSTEYSRPILERSGFVKVSTTTPYMWRR